MKLSRIALPFILPPLALSAPLAAEPGWAFQALLGGAWSRSSRVTIRQDGFQDLRFDANWETKPFTDPPYYSVRLGRWSRRGGWELEMNHHKLYLRNPPPEVEHLEVSHGYNLVTVNRAWDLGPVLVRAGAGPVVAHVEGSVRGRSFGTSGYRWTGPALQVGVERRLALRERWLLGIEGKISAARAVIPVQGGELDAPNVAGHLLVSLGYRWGG
jgi:hypothetical protein